MKNLALLAAAVMFFTACDKSIQEKEEVPAQLGAAKSKGRTCGTPEVMKQALSNNPDYARKLKQLEDQTKSMVTRQMEAQSYTGGTLELPVHVNVLYNTPDQYISDEQIQSQIDVLNEDFSGTNRDIRKVPAIFQPAKAGDVKIHFKWNPANTTRRQTRVTEYSYLNNEMKKASTGIEPTNPSTTLNIWVCNIDAGILGYAYFPGGLEKWDGVVLDNNAFGRGNKYNLYPEYNLGRTASHEVGHYFNLSHIWGDRACGDDLVDDTPTHYSYNFGCPSFPKVSVCPLGQVEMTMNYMDYTDDACLYMFTFGQGARMRATFAPGGPREMLGK